jgi:hypothetical protein
MPKAKTTRRSISIRGIYYQRLKDHCESARVPMSAFIERLVEEALDEAGAPTPTHVVPHGDRKPAQKTWLPASPLVHDPSEPAYSGHWSF